MMKYINPANFGRIDLKNWRDYPIHYTSSLWPANLPSKPADYGSNDFHGRTHPDIIKVALERYTKPGDRVWDCMAGSGTTIDVCKEYGNPCIAYDIHPTRPDIIQADSMTAQEPYNIHLVICHPPYMDIIDYQDGWLSTGNLTDYMDGMANVFEKIRKALCDWRVMVLIVGMVYKDGDTICLDYHLQELLWDFRLLGRVVRPFGETKGGATAHPKNENLWRYRRLKYGIWELNQDVVLFLQKLPAS